MIGNLTKGIAKDARGNATLELAFVMPIVLTMALASVDATMGFLHRMKMQQNAQVGADYVFAKMEDVPLAAVVKAEVALATGVAATKVTVTEWTECDGVKSVAPICVNPTAVETKFMKIAVKDNYTPILKIPGYANYVNAFDSTGSVTVQTQ